MIYANQSILFRLVDPCSTVFFHTEISLEFCGENNQQRNSFLFVPKMIDTSSTSHCFNEAGSKQCTVIRHHLTTRGLALGYSLKGYL